MRISNDRKVLVQMTDEVNKDCLCCIEDPAVSNMNLMESSEFSAFAIKHQLYLSFTVDKASEDARVLRQYFLS